MASLLDSHDLYDRPWKRRTGLPHSTFRLPRRSRRAMYICWAVMIFLLYLVLNSATTPWSHIPNPAGLYAPKEPIPIRFTKLFNSFSLIKGGIRPLNRNILFAAESLEAASKLAGVACEMAGFGRSYVHFAFVGRDDMSIELFKEVNGITDGFGGCQVVFHDARVDFANKMTEDRLKLAIRTALRHLHDFIHPQVVLLTVDHEEEWFVDIARKTTRQLHLQTIELPQNTINDLRWITRLDSASIGAWNKPSYEIVIHADKHSGNLERLLRSLESAFYPSGHLPKSLTIILDPSVPLNALTKSFLSGYCFPSPTRTFIRRPLLPALTAKETAMRFVESFYPSNDDTFLLVLDANIELSKWYFHYLLFTTLEYKYSVYQHRITNTLYGISLEEPPAFLNGTKPFAVPPGESPFLYLAPSSRAALYFPKHWSEFHSFFSKTLQFPISKAIFANKSGPISLAMSKEIAGSWSTSFVDLIRARGYTMLYPSFPRDSLAVFHNEQSYTRSKHSLEKTLMVKNNLLDDLPSGGLPSYNTMTLLDWWGRPTLWDKLELDAVLYRRAISSCPDVSVPKDNFDTGDLFCNSEGGRLE